MSSCVYSFRLSAILIQRCTMYLSPPTPTTSTMCAQLTSNEFDPETAHTSARTQQPSCTYQDAEQAGREVSGRKICPMRRIAHLIPGRSWRTRETGSWRRSRHCIQSPRSTSATVPARSGRHSGTRNGGHRQCCKRRYGYVSRHVPQSPRATRMTAAPL